MVTARVTESKGNTGRPEPPVPARIDESGEIHRLAPSVARCAKTKKAGRIRWNTPGPLRVIHHATENRLRSLPSTALNRQGDEWKRPRTRHDMFPAVRMGHVYATLARQDMERKPGGTDGPTGTSERIGCDRSSLAPRCVARVAGCFCRRRDAPDVEIKLQELLVYLPTPRQGPCWGVGVQWATKTVAVGGWANAPLAQVKVVWESEPIAEKGNALRVGSDFVSKTNGTSWTLVAASLGYCNLRRTEESRRPKSIAKAGERHLQRSA